MFQPSPSTGASFLLGKVVTTPGTVDAHTTKLSEFTKAHGRFLELVSDALLACFAIIAFVVGQTRLDGVTDFNVEGVTQYYTLSSCYETFTHQVQNLVTCCSLFCCGASSMSLL